MLVLRGPERGYISKYCDTMNMDMLVLRGPEQEYVRYTISQNFTGCRHSNISTQNDF